MDEYEDYLSGKIEIPHDMITQLNFITWIRCKITNSPNDSYVNGWFDFKMRGLRDDVRVYGNCAILKEHILVSANEVMVDYWKITNNELRAKIHSEWMRMLKS